MDEAPPAPRTVRFGPFEADTRTGELRRDGLKVPLQDKPFRLLAVLADRPGEVVTREELRRHLWAEATFVDFEHGLNTAVKKLRQALDDSADSPRYVETLARRGYRLIAASPPAPDIEKIPPARRRTWLGLGALCAFVGVAWMAARGGPPLETALATSPSVAVIPFADLSRSPDDAYLADGLTQTLITELARVPGLRVIARESAFQYRGKAPDDRRVGTELGVGHVLSGSLQREGDRLRVTTRLVEVTTGAQVWADKYDRPAREAFALQDDIARSVRRALRTKLAEIGEGGEDPRDAKPEAYDAYLRGLHLASELARTDRSLPPDRVLRLFEQAVEIDPGFALAHATQAQAYADRYFYEDASPEWREKGLFEANRALALDPRLAEALVARADLTWTRANHFPHEEAMADLRRALDRKPNLVGAHWSASRLYSHLGLFDRALAEIEEARRLDPKDPDLTERRGLVQTLGREYSEALESFAVVGAPPDQIQIVVAMWGAGQHQAARQALDEYLRRLPREADGHAYHALMLARGGDHRGAHEEIAQAKRLDRGNSHFHHVQYFIGAAHGVMGEAVEAREWLARAADEGLPCYPCFAGDPDLAGLHGDPGFQDLLTRLQAQWERYRSVL